MMLTVSMVVAFDAGVRREDAGVLAFDGEDAAAYFGEAALVTGTREAMTPTGFAYLTMPLAVSSSMMPHALLREDVAEDAVDFKPLAGTGFGVAEAALFDGLHGEAGEGDLVGAGPAYGLAESVGRGLGRSSR